MYIYMCVCVYVCVCVCVCVCIYLYLDKGRENVLCARGHVPVTDLFIFTQVF